MIPICFDIVAPSAIFSESDPNPKIVPSMRAAVPPRPPKHQAAKTTLRKLSAAEEDGAEGQPLIRLGGVSIGGGLRKKAAGVRPWLLLDSSGQAQIVEAEKQAIMRRTGLPARDLRILDPLLSYPSTVLGRERAIVINLEHIKAIITAQEVLLLNFRDPSVVPFIDELQRRILRHHQAVKSQETGDGESANWTNLYDLEGPQSTPESPNYSKNFPIKEEAGKVEWKKQHGENRDGPKLLPLEFVALEACLEAACSCLDNETQTLEQEAHSALDKLTSKISTLNLERVRQLKSRLVAINGRVQKVRDELEHLLDDDDDMAELYLTDKLQEQMERSSVTSIDEQDVLDEEDVRANVDDRALAEILTEGNDGSVASNADHREQLFGGVMQTFSRGSDGTRTSTHSAISKHVNVGELEILLEAYFVEIDSTLNKLSTLREYVDDTEDYINVMLDDKQNHLLQMGVMVSTATLIISCFVVVTGIFGININIEIFNDKVHGQERFLWTVGGGMMGTIGLYVIAIAWYKHQRLLE